MQNPSDPFAFMRNQWSGLGSGFQFPNQALPPTNLEDLDRRISDLKTVDQWLTLNLNMLKTTIQGLEIQRGTLAAVQSFQDAMGQFGHPEKTPAEGKSSESSTAGADEPNSPSRAAAEQARQQATAWWESMQGQFNQLVQHAQSMTQATAQAADAAVHATRPTKPEAKAPATKSAPAGRARRRSTPK
jgi:hypothetical protein